MSEDREHYEDRLIDLALQERLGGQEPPDLSQRILAASRDKPTPAVRQRAPRRRSYAGVVPMGVSICLIALAFWAAMLWQPQPGSIEVADGGQTLEMPSYDGVLGGIADEGLILGDSGFGAAAPESSLHGHSLLSDFDVHGYRTEPPIAYPDAAAWKELTERRQKWIDARDLDLPGEATSFMVGGGGVFLGYGDTTMPASPYLSSFGLSSREPGLASGHNPSGPPIMYPASEVASMSSVGPLLIDSSVSSAQVTDGTANTMVLGEIGDFAAAVRSAWVSPDGKGIRANGWFEDGYIYNDIPIRVLQDRREQLTREVDQLKTSIDDQQAVVDVPLPTQRLSSQQLADQQARIQEYARALQSLKQTQVAIEARTSGAAPPALEGQILAVGRRDQSLVELSIGSDDGLRQGHRLSVVQDGKLLGRVVVQLTAPDRAVARIEADSRTGPIVKGSLVTTITENAPPKRTWRRARATPNASRLMIGDRDELLPRGLQANVVIDGFRARVLLDYYYYNDRDSQLEGTFKLRLPDEASLYYFAFGETTYEYKPEIKDLASIGFLDPELVRSAGVGPVDILALRSDTWDRVKEARIVPREKASYAYGETTRRRIDPALVEWSGAGVFGARVFPLAPGKLHRIVIGYDVNLQQEGDDLVYRLALPEQVGQCAVDVSLAALPAEAVQISPQVKPVVADGRRHYHFNNPKSDQISVTLNDPGTMMLRGSDAATGDFFAVEFEPPLPAGDEAAGSSHALFLLDTSLSANPERFNLWVDLLQSILEKNRDSMTHFALLVFNIETHWWQERYIENTPRNVATAVRYAHTLSLEGATDLGQALRQAARPSWRRPDQTARPDLFLLSDGALTWGETNLHLVAKPLSSGEVGSLFAYKTGMAPTATSVLDHLARQNGGAVFSVTGQQEVAKAATAHRQRPWQLLEVTLDGGSDLLVAGRPKTIYPRQRLLVVGRSRPATGGAALNGAPKLLLRCKRGDQQRTVVVQIDRTVQSELTPRVYGHVAVGQLESLASAAEDIATAYARHFRITGRTCSLLMLESQQDYDRFDIKVQDDAFVVKSGPAADVIDGKIRQLGRRLQDPKASLIDWLARMERMPGVDFKVSTALRLAIDRMPPEALGVVVPPLDCQLQTNAGAPQEYVTMLAAAGSGGPFDYDAVYAEARRRRAEQGAAAGLKVLSSLVENSPGDTVLISDVAFSAIEWNLAAQAYPLLARVARARPYQPQVYQALGRCLEQLDYADLALVYYELAVGGSWDGRFGDFRQIATVEYARLLRRIVAGELTCHASDFAQARLDTLAENQQLVGADLLVTMIWNTDRTDVDLHVVEPSGEVCSYEHRETASGGRITSDVTRGFGPEMYTLPKALHGKYQVKINYFGSDANRTQTRTKVYITIYENFGTPHERVITKALTLGSQKEMRQVATIGIEK